MNYPRELFDSYTPELQSQFIHFIQKANEFVNINHGKTATIFTEPLEMEDYAKQLQELGEVLVASLKKIGLGSLLNLYLPVTRPARRMAIQFGENLSLDGPGITRHGDTVYHVLERIIFPHSTVEGNNPRTIIAMIQSLPAGFNTKDEIHGVKKNDGKLFATKDEGGIELHIALTDNRAVFINNDRRLILKPFEGTITLPGDIHRIENPGGRTFNLILMALGALPGTKVNEVLIEQGIFGAGADVISLPMNKYNISRKLVF